MAIEHITQSEVKDPPYGKIAEALLTIASDAKAQGQDQETIRVMIHAFSSAASSAANQSLPQCSDGPRRY